MKYVPEKARKKPKKHHFSSQKKARKTPEKGFRKPRKRGGNARRK
jgi:hypothetical protein